MLDRFLFGDWEEAPASMTFESRFGETLDRIATLLGTVFARLEAAERGELSPLDSFYPACEELYYTVPAIVNVALNYKICVEQGLPLHPTYYFEVRESERFKASYPDSMVERANSLFVEAIATAKSVYALDRDCALRLHDFISRVPEVVLSFVYSSTADKYTWRGSDPEKIGKLARAIKRSGGADFLFGAAHGSIMSGIMLSCMLGCGLYFVRFSMFKRNDERPIVSRADEAVFAAHRNERVVLFDEDIAKGTTMTIFEAALAPYFASPKTAGVIRHALAMYKPDFSGVQWYD